MPKPLEVLAHEHGPCLACDLRSRMLQATLNTMSDLEKRRMESEFSILRKETIRLGRVPDAL